MATRSLPAPSPSSSFAVRASPPRSPQRKSPPPPPLNLDDCRPKFTSPRAVYGHSPTAHSTPGSSSSSASGATSFVFTSSRTKPLKTPLDPPLPPKTTHTSRPPSPKPRRSSSPVSATASTTSTVRSLKARPAPALTPTQLARHGEGAMDARRILGPNMRAAGFVHLASTLTSPATSPGIDIPGPSTHMGSAPVQVTPTDPPLFPPIVFVPPSEMKRVSMWEYQRWPPAHATPPLQQAAAATNAGKADASVRPHHTRSTSASAAAPDPALRSASYADTGALYPSPQRYRRSSSSSSSGMQHAAKGKERDMGLATLDEYPFPRAGPPPSPSTRSGRTASPEFASNAAWTAAAKPKAAKTKDRDRDKKNTKEQSQPHPLSIAELCEPVFAWTAASSSVFVPPYSGGRADETEGSSPSPPETEGQPPVVPELVPVQGRKEREQARREMEPGPVLAPIDEDVEKEKEKERHREKHTEREREAEKKHIAGLVAAHRERDEDHVRYVAAERERERERGGQTSPGHAQEKKDAMQREKEKEKGGRTSPKEREHRDRERTSPGHKERKSRRHSPKHIVHKTKSLLSDATSALSDAETMVGETTPVGGAHSEAVT